MVVNGKQGTAAGQQASGGKPRTGGFKQGSGSSGGQQGSGGGKKGGGASSANIQKGYNNLF